MAFILADRVRETTPSTGTGPLTLVGAPVGFRTFSSVMSSGDTTYYTVVATFGADWEVGVGTFTAGTLVRNTVLSSSIGGALVPFTAGSKAVFISQPAGKAVYALGSDIVSSSALVAISGGGTGQTTKAAAFNALSPITAAGDLIIGNGVNSATRLSIGTNSQVLTSNGTTATWATFSVVAGVSSVSFGGTGLTPAIPTSGAIVVGGTLAVANGGTGVTTSTGSGSNVLSTSPVLTTPNIGTPSAAVLTNATGLPLTTGVTGTLPIGSGGTGATTKATAFDALSPTSTTGDLIVGGAGGTGTRLAVGANGQVLTSNGTTVTWAAAAAGVSTISFGSTGLTPSTPTSGAVAVGGILALTSGGTGQTTKAAAYNALTPITATGDLVIGNGVNSATRLGIGANTQVLTSNGTTAAWAAIGAATSAATATTATNLAGATPWSLPYQSAAATTAYLPPGTAGEMLISAGSAAPTWGSTVTTVTSTADTNFNGVLVGRGGGNNVFNTRVGVGTLAVNTGTQNTAFGYNALAANTFGTSATAMGFGALQSHTTGISNTAFGQHALQTHTTGFGNTAHGVSALRLNVSGNSNTAVGATALDNATGTTNTAIGAGSGSAITTGSGNSILGRFTGNQGGYDIRTSSNNVVLSDGDGNVKLIADASGNVGVNTASTSGGRLVISQSGAVQPAILLPVDESIIQGPTAGTQIRMGGNLVLSGTNLVSITSTGASSDIRLSVNGTEGMRLDANRNLGLGVPPSASWRSNAKAVQVGITGNVSIFEQANGASNLAFNTIETGVNTFSYQISSFASRYGQVGGSHTFFTAPSGTAGNAITFTQSLAVGLGTTLALEGATSAAGTGIAFPATQLASSNANTFDDFERANWTPTQGAGLTVVGTFSSSGRYVKKGNEVTITGTISGSTSIAFSAGGIICAGIPFATGFDSAGTFVASTNTSGGQIRVSSVSITAATAQGAVTSVTFTATYIV